MYAFVVGDTLLVGVEDDVDEREGNRLSVPSLDAAGWVHASARSTAAAPLRFLASARNRKLELMPLNEVTHEVYTVYYNITVRL